MKLVCYPCFNVERLTGLNLVYALGSPARFSKEWQRWKGT